MTEKMTNDWTYEEAEGTWYILCDGERVMELLAEPEEKLARLVTKALTALIAFADSPMNGGQIFFELTEAHRGGTVITRIDGKNVNQFTVPTIVLDTTT